MQDKIISCIFEESFIKHEIINEMSILLYIRGAWSQNLNKSYIESQFDVT